MELKHIDIVNLTVSTANMRGKGKAPCLANILPSIRARGILVPLIVRPVSGDRNECGDERGSPQQGDEVQGRDEQSLPQRFEIVAGKRRYLSALAIAEEAGGIDPLPCAVIEAGDDAAALEASLIENVARLDPDEVTRWETFTRLVREGRSAEDIALTFGLTELMVKRTLSLGNLMPRIRNLYRDERIDASTVRHLTLASKAQQKEWLAMLDDPNAYCPTGSQLKAWLFGGMSIPTATAIFDLASYEGEIVSDLFGEDTYFASADAFWAAQRAAIVAMADTYREDGWSEVVVLEPDQYFHSWEHERRAKAKGGKVYIELSHRGDVTVQEGYIGSKDARRRERGEAVAKAVRPELTAPLANYVDLHRHSAVRAKLAAEPAVALRLVVAHMIAGSCLWHVRVEPQHGATGAIAESVETSASETEFDLYRRAVLAALDFDPDTPTVTGGYDGQCGISGLFVRLLTLSDEAVLDALAIVMGETLEAGTAMIETLGRQLNIGMAETYVADSVLLDLIKDREVLDAIVAEVAGADAAAANAKATGKVKRQIIADCLAGGNGRTKVERFVPRWMTFPPAAYTERGGVGSVSRDAVVEPLFAAAPEQPEEGLPPAEPMAEAA